MVPEQAKIVEYIFNSYAEKGRMILSKELNEKKIPTQRNHLWSSSTKNTYHQESYIHRESGGTSNV